MSAQVDPSHIMQVGMGFWGSKTLLSAVELDLFTKLGSDGMTAEQIAKDLDLDDRAVPDFPDALVALELLDREVHASDAVYRNTEAGAVFLDKASPAYIGGLLEMANARLYPFWGDLTEALRTGEPQNEIKHTGKPMFDELYADEARLEQFMNAMAGISAGPFMALQRGARTVVEYREVRTRSGMDQAFHAVLQAGRAHGASEADQALEEFLRAAEPPAHEEWTHTTDRIRAEYGQGFKKALDDLFEAIDAAVRDLTREEVVESDEGPDALRKLFPLPGVGGIARTETYRLTEARADLNGDRWNFDARYRRNPTDDHERERDWQFKVTLGVDQEGTGAPTRIPIGELNVAAPASAADVASDRTVTVSVPSGPNEVSFEGVSGPVAELPPGGLRRVRLRMDLKASTRKEAEA